ncbi:band 4.1-like protein 2 isoform X4 [Lineus longissimus]|uniref:band 4.1-like protein 2 isoform X4 n=1 Tax=Lineus longissimus TaxID=88925 RepID=UPI00315C88B1
MFKLLYSGTKPLRGALSKDQTQDSDNKPSFDETVSDSEHTPPRYRANNRHHEDDDDFPDPEDFNSDIVASSPVKREAPDDFDGEEEEAPTGEEAPGEEESWHPISDKAAKEEAKKAKKAEKDEKARLAKLEKEEKARIAKVEKEEKARIAKEEKEEKARKAKEEKEEKARLAQEAKGKTSEEKKEQREREKMERQSKREKTPKEKKEKPAPRPQVRNPRLMLARVLMLDGETIEIEIEKSARGQVLHDVICENQNLEERDYFGMTYVSEKIWFWLDPEKKIGHQLKKSDWDFEFRVKFYAPEPTVMKVDITRYFLCQQIRNDINIGKLPCSMLTGAILGSYTVQSELGDYEPETAEGIVYMSDYQFVPNQTPELLMRIADLHRVHKGQMPAEADIHFLENAMKLAMYGVDLHQVWDSENVELMLGICWAGVNVYKDKLRINRFPWPKILKISYKKNRFFLKIRPGEFEHFENTIGFKCRNHIMAKRLWKVAVEQHTFFRKKEPEVRFKHLLPKFGSKFRYSGRTIHQSRIANVHDACPTIDRSFTLRKSRSMNVGGSLTRLNLTEGYGSLDRDQGYNTRLNRSDAGYAPGHFRQASGSSDQLHLPHTLEEPAEGSVTSSIPDYSSVCSSLPPRGPYVALYNLPAGSARTRKEYYVISSTERLCESPIDKDFQAASRRPVRAKKGEPRKQHPDGHLHPPGWPDLLNSETPHSLDEVNEEQVERGEEVVVAAPVTPTLEVRTQPVTHTYEYRDQDEPVVHSTAKYCTEAANEYRHEPVAHSTLEHKTETHEYRHEPVAHSTLEYRTETHVYGDEPVAHSTLEYRAPVAPVLESDML